MRKSDKIRAIYKELRCATGSEVAAGDLIRIANMIFRAYQVQEDEIDSSGEPRASRAIGSLEVDEAMDDGGWKIWSYEAHRAGWMELLSTAKEIELEAELQTYLGPTWRYQAPQD